MGINQHYDYIIVGTGPGGGTVARELADGVRSILIIEHGPRVNKTGFLNIASKVFLDKNKKLTVSDEGVYFGKPRLLGGASYVAMGNAANPPGHILDEWGLNLSKELEWARKVLRVNPMPRDRIGPATEKINQAAASLGHEMKPTPKCVDFSKCTGCSLCMFGCPAGAKWNTVEFVEHAQVNGADLLVNTEVTRILHQSGKVTGVSALYKNKEIDFKAHTVILAAGALSTPVILQNSGIPAGKGLAGDIFQTTYGYHPELGMKGEVILATYLESAITDKELFPAPYMYIPFIVQRDKDGGQPEKMGVVQQAKTLMKSNKIDTSHLMGMMTKIRDERSGTVNPDGSISKKITEHDKIKLEEAHQLNKEILLEAGVDENSVFTGVYESGHPCCTAAIGEVVDEYQETEIDNLFVADASVFPSPLGLPPILTIVAMSKRLTGRLTDDE